MFYFPVVSVIFNEPLTFLQRIAEYMEYVYLLHKAASLEDPLQRMQVTILTFTTEHNACLKEVRTVGHV